MKGNIWIQTSYPVVVDQFVGFHFVLCSDGSLALDLHPAVITGMMARTLNNKQQVDKLVLKNTPHIGD